MVDTFTSSTLATDSTSVKTCTITTSTDHDLSVGDIIELKMPEKTIEYEIIKVKYV